MTASNTVLGGSDDVEVLTGDVYLIEQVLGLDTTHSLPGLVWYVDGSRCRIVRRGVWLYFSWPVGDDSDEYTPGGKRRLWGQTTILNIRHVAPTGECPEWLK